MQAIAPAIGSFAAQGVRGVIGSLYFYIGYSGARSSLQHIQEIFREPSLSSLAERAAPLLLSLNKCAYGVTGFINWGNQKAWFALLTAHKFTLNAIAGFSGAVYYCFKAVEGWDKIQEMQRLSLWAIQHDIVTNEMESQIYSLWLSIASDLTWSLSCGLQFVSCVAIAAIPPAAVFGLHSISGTALLISYAFRQRSALLDSQLNQFRAIELARRSAV